MSTTPLSGSILAHIFLKDEKLSYLKSLGVLIGFSGIVLLFFDKVIINSENYIYALDYYIRINILLYWRFVNFKIKK